MITSDGLTMTATIRGYPDCKWPAFLTAAEIARITNIPERVILDYAESGDAPHVKLNGRDIRFLKDHILRWIKANLLAIQDGRILTPVPVILPHADVADVPVELSAFSHMLHPLPAINFAGIYFLCQCKKVVYVGQSRRIGSRVFSHTDKHFDRFFVLPCPEGELARVEAAFIGLLKPPLNGKPGGRESSRPGDVAHSNGDYEAYRNPIPVVERFKNPLPVPMAE